MRIAIRVNKNNFFEVNEILYENGFKWKTGESISENMSVFLHNFKNSFKEECILCLDTEDKSVMFGRNLKQLELVNKNLKETNRETFKIIEIEELKEMLKVNLYAIEVKNDKGVFYVEDITVKGSSMKVEATDSIKRAMLSTKKEELEEYVKTFKRLGTEAKVIPVIEDDKPVNDVEEEINKALEGLSDEKLQEVLKECVEYVAKKLKDKIK